jgi:hypothetical protein
MWNPEQRKRKQGRNRVSKRTADQTREDFVCELENRLWSVIERLGSVETEVARLRESNCALDFYTLNNQLPLPSVSSQLGLGVQSKFNLLRSFSFLQWSDWPLDSDAQWLSQCSVPSEHGTSDFLWAQYLGTPSCLGIDELSLPKPELEPVAELQFTGFINDSSEKAEFPQPNMAESFAQPCHSSDPDPEEVLRPDGLEITQGFDEVIAIIHTLNGTRQVRKENEINEDFLIRAVFEGWQSVFRFEYGRTCPLWSILCRVDSVLYQNCCVALRLAHLRAIYRMFMVCFTFACSACFH